MSNNIKKINKADDEEFDLSKMVANFLGYWKLILISVVVSSLLAFIYLKYATPLYNIHAKLLVEEQQNSASSSIFSSSAISSEFGDLFDVQSSVDNEAEILKTRDLMEKVVRALNLNVTYFQQGQLHASELYKRNPYIVTVVNFNDSLSISPYTIALHNHVFTLENDDLHLKRKAAFGDTIAVAGGSFTVTRTSSLIDSEAAYTFTIVSIDATVANYIKNFLVSLTGDKISTIDLELSSNIPYKGEEVVTTLIREYLNGNVQEKNKFADSTIAFINTRLQIVNGELSGIENNVQAFKQNNNIANLQEQSSLILNNSSDYYKQLNELDVQLDVSNTMLNYLKDNKNNTRPMPALSGTPDPTFTGLIERYNVLQAQRDRLLLNNTEENPYVQNINEQIENVRRDLYHNLQNQQKNLQIAKAKIVAENGTITGTIRKVPEQERQFLDLSRQQDIKQALFLYLLQKKEEVEVSKASNIAGARVIDHAKAEVQPYFPNRLLIMGGGFLFGLIAPVGFIIMRNLLNTRIETKDDIEHVTKVPIIGEISHNDQKETIVVSNDSRTPIAEQFRALRTNLQFYLNGKNEKNILVTSSMSGEGKSFSSLNLAMALAISNKKVLLMELDLRKPNITVQLPVAPHIGFTNYVISPDVKATDIVVPSGLHDNFFFVSSGAIPPNPSEILLSPRVEELLNELKAKYDYVIMDAPPIGVVTDAQLLSKCADLCLYLVRQKHTFKNQLQIPQDLYENDKMKKIALLVNDVVARKGYGYGYGYGYAYGYGYNGVQDNKKNTKMTGRKKKLLSS